MHLSKIEFKFRSRGQRRLGNLNCLGVGRCAGEILDSRIGVVAPVRQLIECRRWRRPAAGLKSDFPRSIHIRQLDADRRDNGPRHDTCRLTEDHKQRVSRLKRQWHGRNPVVDSVGCGLNGAAVRDPDLSGFAGDTEGGIYRRRLVGAIVHKVDIGVASDAMIKLHI